MCCLGAFAAVRSPADYVVVRQMVIDNAERAMQAHEWIDANPLGTAAGYGVQLCGAGDISAATLFADPISVLSGVPARTRPGRRRTACRCVRSSTSKRSAARCSTHL